MRTIAIFLAILYAFTPYALSFAQGTPSVALISNPTFPEAGEAYELTLRTVNLGAQRSDIVWFIDGIEATEFKNSSTLQVAQGKDPANVTVRLSTDDGIVYERAQTRNPYRVDILTHADTTVPPFYNGSALPSSGSDIRFTALVFKNDVLTTSGLTYLWKVNGKVINGGALVGQNKASFKPGFENELSVSVDVINAQGAILTSETAIVPIVKPELYFYEENPLRGLSTRALQDPHTFVGEEMTLQAEPYFVNKGLIQKDDTYAQWLINGQPVDTNNTTKNKITLSKEGNTGASTLLFHIRNMEQLLQGVKDSITIRF